MRSSTCSSWILGLLGAGLLLAGCSGSSGDGGSVDSAVTLAVTDAASDELASFVVEIESVQLTRAGGGVVGALPQPVTVDLVTLAEVSQVLNVLDVPAGRYTAAEVTLDFTDAEVHLLGETNPASIVDGDAIPVTGLVQLPIELGGGFDALGNRHHLLELDFDLDQSVAVDAGANTVVLEPALVFRVDRSDPKELILGGELASVDQAASRFTLDVETLGGLPICSVEVAVDLSTVYQVDGVPAQGAPGLTALAALAPDTWVQIYGEIDPLATEIDALYVEAGGGTYNGGQDIVDGHVVGRIGPASALQFIVLGHSNDASHTQFQFNTTFAVNTTFADTKVLVRGAQQTFDTEDVNIGQRVRVFGTLSGQSLDATGATSVLRLEPTRVLGFASDAPQAGALTIELVRVDLRPADTFEWNDGGTTPPDPDALEILVGNLGDGLDIAAGTPVEALGFFTAVDTLFAHDFAAGALVNRALAPSLLAIHDRADGLSVVTTVAADEIRFTLSGTAGPGEFAVLDEGFVGVTPLPAAPEPTVVPNALGVGLFVIRDRPLGTCALFLRFDDFAAALDTLLGRGAELYNFGAIGKYTDATKALEAGLVFVVVN